KKTTQLFVKFDENLAEGLVCISHNTLTRFVRNALFAPDGAKSFDLVQFAPRSRLILSESRLERDESKPGGRISNQLVRNPD
ncbi:hypothetical protein KKA47_04535, partial [bacterium]|nr:hypothetical protein [bacterium]